MKTPSINRTLPSQFDVDADTLIIGAGACGLVAALAAVESGKSPIVIEADAVPSGSTALSAGLIPAAGTSLQKKSGLQDNPKLFAEDIQAKANGENDQALVDTLAHHAAPIIDWLTNRHGLPMSVVDDFDYPGHSRRRMHGLPTRSGAELIDRLRQVCEENGIDIICNRRARQLFVTGDRIAGVLVDRDDGVTETISCARLILACNGFGGNRKLVTLHMPDIKDGLWFGHDGNQGEALSWGEALGAQTQHLGAYQGHGNVAHPHGILITWAVITEGGFQTNLNGDRFWNEAQGYSEAARAVLSQPQGVAFTIFDQRIANIARQFEDFKRAETVGAIHVADTLVELANKLHLPSENLAQTLAEIQLDTSDRFGRNFAHLLAPPFCGVRVTGALFHTQGGLCTDTSCRVVKADGSSFPNLYAAGGAACGVSGRSDTGYLSGNGLLSALVLGYISGKT